MKFSKLKKAFLPISALCISGLTIAGFIHWSVQDFRPVLMNFEAYLSEDAIKEIQKNFQYKVFSELNEFSRAVESERVVGGVASDFEIARLAIGNKISKVKYDKILRNIPELQVEETRAMAFEENGMLKKTIVSKYLRTETMEHMDSYNDYLIDMKGKRIDHDNDGRADEMWEYMLPYYIQDKVLAYTSGVYEKGGVDSEGNEITVPLRRQSYAALSDEEKEKGIRFDEQTFSAIGKKLVSKKFNKFTWTEASRDNLLIGSEAKNAQPVSSDGIYSGYVTPQNYISMIEGFLEVVKNGTGRPVSDISRNRFLSSGNDILQSLINPNSDSDVGVMYNGDALDALYSRDNFSSVPDGQIKYIRPKNNITLLEGWVFAKANNFDLNKKIYDALYNSIYKGIDYTEEALFAKIAKWVQTPFFIKNSDGKFVFETKKNDGVEKVIWEKNGQKNYALTINYSTVPVLRNFDYMNYTPSWRSDFNLIKKLYFNDATTSLVLPNETEEITFLWKDETLISTAIASDLKFIEWNDYDPEVKGDLNSANTELAKKLETISFADIDNETVDSLTKLLLNVYVTQQKEQTVYGTMVEKDTLPEDIYQIRYESLKPITDKLRSEVITEYNLKTKN